MTYADKTQELLGKATKHDLGYACTQNPPLRKELSMTLDDEALELVARAIWDNHPQNQTPVNQLTGPILYEFMRNDLLAVANVAITAYLSALEAKGMVIEQGWQPIETAPKGVFLMLYSKNWNGVFDTDADEFPGGKPPIPVFWKKPNGIYYEGIFNEEFGRWYSYNRFKFLKLPTRWRPIPAPPAMLSATDSEAGGG